MIKFAVKSDTGKVRQINEDSYNIIQGIPGITATFVIADGMGGHNSGEVASKIAVDSVSNYLLQSVGKFNDENEIKSYIKDAIKKANIEIFNKSNENEIFFGMGTTFTATVILNKRLIIGHVGDSRVYVLRKGKMIQLTIDHSFIEELIKKGTLTREEAENHPKRNVITRALGCEEDIEIDTYLADMIENDVFILCTDGLTNMLSESEIRNIIINAESLDEACNGLVKKALKKGGEDNITVILFIDDNI